MGFLSWVEVFTQKYQGKECKECKNKKFPPPPYFSA